VLTGRHAPGAASQAIIEACRAAGADVHVRAVDASDDGAMSALLSAIDGEMPPLRGIVHAAGVLDDGLLLNLTWERWRAVLQGKACGARILDALTQHRSLDFLIMYSAAGLHLGPLGQGPYAAANAELEALASSRRDRGLPALSIAWGMWPEAGMAAELASRGANAWSARGLGWIDPDHAFEQVAQLLAAHATQVIAAPIDWVQFLERLPAGEDRSFFRAVEPMVRRASAAPALTSTSQVVSVVDGWRAAPASAWRELVIAHVLERTRQVLGMDDLFVIPEGVALKDVGLDSLMAVELRNVLTRSLGSSLPATLLFDYPSLDALSNYLLRTFDLLPAVPNAVVSVPVDLNADVATLSDEEAEALLLAELNSLNSLNSEGRR
jgi:acyl carrier protein